MKLISPPGSTRIFAGPLAINPFTIRSPLWFFSKVGEEVPMKVALLWIVDRRDFFENTFGSCGSVVLGTDSGPSVSSSGLLGSYEPCALSVGI